MENTEELYQSAVLYIRSNAGKFNSNDLLYFYARYKQVTDGKCNTPKPGWFDFQGKSKWEAWKAMENASKDDCMHDYVAKLSDLEPDWQEKSSDGDVNTQKKSSGMGVAVSVMAPTEEEYIPDVDKNIFDWVKEDNQEKVAQLITKQSVNQQDEEGLTLLHWACDRGLEEMVKCLIKHDANIDKPDNEGQTPLHYAASCEHKDIVQLLLEHGADKKCTDNDNCTAFQVTENKEIRHLLESS